MLSRVELCRAVCPHPSAVVTQFPILQPTPLGKSFQFLDQIRRELVANSIHTADVTQLDNWVAWGSTMTATSHDNQLGEIYLTMLNELNCTFGVSFCTSSLLWSYVMVMVWNRHGVRYKGFSSLSHFINIDDCVSHTYEHCILAK